MSDRPKEFDARVIQWLPFLKKMAFKMERNAQDREDLVNEAVATALHRWASYRPEGSFPGWLVFQMRERCRAMRDQKERRKEVQPSMRLVSQFDDGVDSIATAYDRASTPPTQDATVELAQVLDLIPGRYQTVMAKLAAGYEPKEIAESEGVSRQAIHQRVTACRSQLLKVAA